MLVKVIPIRAKPILCGKGLIKNVLFLGFLVITQKTLVKAIWNFQNLFYLLPRNLEKPEKSP